ncbi:MAG: hypothetical protein R3C32_11625 [Chloroflexota bacterium]
MVAAFARPGGDIGVLVRSADRGQHATLEGLVMGYLAAARGGGHSDAPVSQAA